MSKEKLSSKLASLHESGDVGMMVSGYAEEADMLEQHVTELEAHLPKWISVDELLPEYGSPVIISINGVVQHITYTLDGSDISADWFEPFRHEEGSDALFINSDNDIHWMPLPNPPKE